MIKYLIVFTGAGIGGTLRYWLSALVFKFLPAIFPFSTLTVNAIGSFLLGILIFGLDEKELIDQNVKLFLGIGFCGGFTTFSSFSYETLNLILDSQIFYALLNLFLNCIISLVAIYFAYLITR